jgi:acyl homoserine lactone synthase
MPITIVSPRNNHQFPALLADMHLMRTRVFRDRMKWDVRVVNGLEIDQFDSLSPTYVLYTEGGRVLGCWRLLPTVGPNMLRDVFPQLLDDGMEAPADPAVWECSRFAVDCPVDEADGLYAVNRVTATLFAGLIEHGIATKMREIVTVYDVRIAKLLKRIGVEPTWQSKRQRIGNTIAVAGRFDVNEAVLRDVMSRAEIAGSPIAAAPWLDDAGEVAA